MKENNTTIRHDLRDFTFIIPLRIDSGERKENLELVIAYLLSHYKTRVMVLEADVEERISLPNDVEKIFIKDNDPVFHHSKYRNYMIKRATTEYIALWDADAIGPANQVVEACDKLRKEEADLIFPYDGHYYNVPHVIKNVYKEAQSIDALLLNINILRLMHSTYSFGGAILINKRIYVKAGIENENFYGWGPEDYERVIRCEILGYKISRINGPLFHLDHPRGRNSSFFSAETMLCARLEFLNVCEMNKPELNKYVNSNKWNSE